MTQLSAAGKPIPPTYNAGGNDSGNGSLMRFGPIAFRKGDETIQAFMKAQARTYVDYLDGLPGTPQQNDGRFEMMKLLNAQEPVGSTEYFWNWTAADLPITATLQRRKQGEGGLYNGYRVLPTYTGAYSMDGLAIAMHSVYHSTSFVDAISRAVNHLGDADSTGSIAGQIAGAFYGFSSIPQPLVDDMNAHCDGDIAFRALLLHHVGMEFFRSPASQLPATSAAPPQEKSNGSGMIIFLVILAVVLSAGIAVGVYLRRKGKSGAGRQAKA